MLLCGFSAAKKRFRDHRGKSSASPANKTVSVRARGHHLHSKTAKSKTLRITENETLIILRKIYKPLQVPEREIGARGSAEAGTDPGRTAGVFDGTCVGPADEPKGFRQARGHRPRRQRRRGRRRRQGRSTRQQARSMIHTCCAFCSI